MGKTVDDYISGLSSWQAATAQALRADILATGAVVEAMKWGHPVFEAGGPVCLIKAAPRWITFGFWRGVELKDLDARLGGDNPKMAYIKLSEGQTIGVDDVARLVRAGVALNREKGDPLKAK